MQTLIIKLPDRQKAHLIALTGLTGLNTSEMVRRMLDHCCQDAVLNVLVPPMSGRLAVG